MSHKLIYASLTLIQLAGKGFGWMAAVLRNTGNRTGNEKVVTVTHSVCCQSALSLSLSLSLSLFNYHHSAFAFDG